MPRYKLIIEYDGTPFSGWQWQDHAPSVQRALADALVAFCGHEVKVAGAGRTDAGVHALGQVAHVDLEKDWRTDQVRDALNAHLRPHPVAVLAAEKVADGFDARFSAVKRHYLYRIANRRPDLALDRLRGSLDAIDTCKPAWTSELAGNRNGCRGEDGQPGHGRDRAPHHFSSSKSLGHVWWMPRSSSIAVHS